MSGDDGSYAPKSPDLSSFYSADQPNFSSYHQTHAPHTGQQQHHQFGAPPPQTPAQARPTASPPALGAYYGVGVGYSSTAQHDYIPPRAPAQSVISGQSQFYTATSVPQQPSYYQPRTPHRASFQYEFPLTASQAQVRQQQHCSYQVPPAPAALPIAGAQGPGIEVLPEADLADQPPDSLMPPRRAAATAAAAALAAQAANERKSDMDHQQQAPTAAAAPASSSSYNTTSAIMPPGVVKTKFPTARIKRIMQADEEVGKVAQQTPIAVGKALELFMVALVSRSAELARQRSSKRVSAQMLRQVVEADDQWDFLREIVAKVEAEEKSGGGKGGGGANNAAAGGSGSRGKADSETEGEDERAGSGGAGGKKKRGGGRRKVKGE